MLRLAEFPGAVEYRERRWVKINILAQYCCTLLSLYHSHDTISLFRTTFCQRLRQLEPAIELFNKDSRNVNKARENFDWNGNEWNKMRLLNQVRATLSEGGKHSTKLAPSSIEYLTELERNLSVNKNNPGFHLSETSPLTTRTSEAAEKSFISEKDDVDIKIEFDNMTGVEGFQVPESGDTKRLDSVIHLGEKEIILQYRRLCHSSNVPPCSSFIKQLELQQGVIILRHYILTGRLL
jgi:hypothetical protein